MELRPSSVQEKVTNGMNLSSSAMSLNDFKMKDSRRELKRSGRSFLGTSEKMPVTVRGRYRWSGLDSAGRWQFIDYYGCDNRDCSEKAELLRHCQRPTGDEAINKEMDRRLYEWGKNMVICDACRSKPYCGVNCQQAAASSHAARCALIQRRQNQAINPPPADPMGWFQE